MAKEVLSDSKVRLRVAIEKAGLRKNVNTEMVVFGAKALLSVDKSFKRS